MRIAIVTERFPPSLGGIEVRYFEIAKRLARWGHEVHVYAICEGNHITEKHVKNMYIHRVIRSDRYLNERGTRAVGNVSKLTLAIRRQLNKEVFDIYDFNQFPYLPAILTRKHPSIVTWLEVWCKEALRYTGAIMFIPIRILEKMLTLVPDQHIAISQLTRNRLINDYHIQPEKIKVIPCGIDTNAFRENPKEKVFGRLCYIGRLSSHKHIEVIIGAFLLLRKEYPEVELHIAAVPNEPCLSYYQRLTKNMQGVYVYSIDRIKAIEILKSSYLFLSASEREGFGMAALEAMASGTVPVVAQAPLSATNEVVINNYTGILTNPTPHNFMSAVRYLFNNEDTWCKLSNNGKEYSQKYDWDKIAKSIEHTYLQVLAGSKN
jgi:glycosyltransferase involved in cell wall biosynthesis